MQLMLQATVCDCLALDPFAFEEDGLSAPEVDVSWGKIVEALVIAGMVVMRDEGRDLAFEVAGQVVVLKEDSVLECLMPALNLALGLRVIRGAADVFHFLLIQPMRGSSATYDAPLETTRFLQTVSARQFFPNSPAPECV